MGDINVSGADTDTDISTDSSITNNLPEGNTTFTRPAGIASDGESTDSEIATSSTITNNLPEGNTTFTRPAGIGIVGADTRDKKDVGVGTFGYVWAQTTVPDGKITINWVGTKVTDGTITTESYRVVGVPSGVSGGSSVSDRSGASEAVAETESGGISKQTISQHIVERASFNFSDLTVQVNDVDGNPVSKSPFTVAGNDFTTGAGGSDTLQSSGTVTVTALRDSKSRSVTVSGQVTETFTFAGVSGKVRGASNNPITQTTVKLLDSNGDEIARTTTDDTGKYRFTTAPVNSSLTVEAIGISRDFTSPGEGTETTKNIPFDTGSVQSVEVQCFDADTGQPVVAVDCTIGSNSAETDSDGVGLMSTTATGDVTMTVSAADRRYEEQSVTANLSSGENFTAQIDLEPKRPSTNVS